MTEFYIIDLNSAPVAALITCFEDGVVSIRFGFNDVDNFKHIYELINNYNIDNDFFKAFIDKDDFFCLVCQSWTASDEEQVIDFIKMSFNFLLLKDNIKQLKPIVKKLIQ